MGGTLREVGRVLITRLVKVPGAEMLGEEEDVKEDSVGIFNIQVEKGGGENPEDDQELQEEMKVKRSIIWEVKWSKNVS